MTSSRPARRFTAKVVGLTFVDDYPANLHQLRDVQDTRQRRTDEPLTAVLVRNAANAHDDNAVEVHSPAVGMLGHIPRPIAARLAPCLDAGETWAATLGDVRIDPEHPEKPGVDVHVRHVPPEEDHR